MAIDAILTAVVTAAATSGAIGVIFKRWVDHSFSAKLAELEAKNRMAALEHQVRFTRYDEKVAAAIEGAYDFLCQYSDSVREQIKRANDSLRDQPIQDPDSLDEIASDFSAFVQRQSIYLPADVARKLIETRIALRDAYMEELHSIRSRTEKVEVGSQTFLASVYQNAGLAKKCDDIMADLQGQAREHLSKFSVLD